MYWDNVVDDVCIPDDITTCDGLHWLSGTYCVGGSTYTELPAGQCAKGTYSQVGAAEYKTCPSTGLTDKDGNTVTATTADTGATGMLMGGEFDGYACSPVAGHVEMSDILYDSEAGYCYMQSNGNDVPGAVWDGTRCTCSGKWESDGWFATCITE
ncbi:MAG: hypothetical protein IKB10_00435 [Alphaproteobacteria bacterium]|nr:hypothetical protein [Alphaproteobacteria bacterium]